MTVETSTGTPARRLVVVVTALSLAVLAAGHIVIALSRAHETTSDWASIEMRTRDVFSRHPPLIGAWSRFEWSHPGPLLFYVLAIPYRLGGQTWQSLWVGAILVNTAAIALAVWLGARRSPGLALAFLVAGLATVAGFRSHLFTDVWNATIVVLPVLLVLAAVMSVLAGDRAGLPVLVLSFMFVAQSHFGYGVVLAPVAAWAAVVAMRRWRRPTVRWLGIGVALWIPVAIDTLANWPGNFLTSVGWNLTAGEQARGAGEALRVVGRATSLTFVTTPGIPSFDVAIERAPIGFVPFAALIAALLGWWASRRWQLAEERRGLEVVGLTWLVGLVAVARIKGPLFRWIVDWTYPLAALTWALVVLVGCRVAVRVAPRLKVPLAAGATVAAAALVATNLTGSVGEPYINAAWVPIVRQFTEAAITDSRVGREPILLDFEGDPRLTGAIQSGMLNLMEKGGDAPQARPDQGLQFGGQRVQATRPEHLLVRAETTLDPLPDADVVSVWDPLSTDERAEADALVGRLAALLTANGRADKVPILDTPVADLAAYQAPPAVIAEIDAFRRLAELRNRGARVVLYFVPG